MGARRPLPVLVHRPVVRDGRCTEALRPCPWVGCPEHLAIDLIAPSRPDRNPPSAIRFNWVAGAPVIKESDTDDAFEAAADALVDALGRAEETCAIDVAQWGGATYTEMAVLMGTSDERVRQLAEDIVDRLGDDDSSLARQLRRWL